MAAAASMDVSPDEFVVGLHPMRRDTVQCRTFSLFMSDNLENGSGLTEIISSKDKFIEVIDEHLNNVTWENITHRDSCDNSCANCLRTYQNISYHHELDWRLALDLAELITGRPLNRKRWFDDVMVLAENFKDNFNMNWGDEKILDTKSVDNVPVIFDNLRKSSSSIAPLWHSRELNSEQENLKYGVEEEIARNISTSFVDLREFRALPQVQQLKFFEND